VLERKFWLAIEHLRSAFLAGREFEEYISLAGSEVSLPPPNPIRSRIEDDSGDDVDDNAADDRISPADEIVNVS
jgi:hypothetical protein